MLHSITLEEINHEIAEAEREVAETHAAAEAAWASEETDPAAFMAAAAAHALAIEKYTTMIHARARLAN